MLTSQAIHNTLIQLELKRARIGYSQEEVAQMLNVHKNTFRNWKNTNFEQMQVGDLMRYLDLLETLDQPRNPINGLAHA